MSTANRPTPWEVACAFSSWKGYEDRLQQVIQTPDITAIHGPTTSDGLDRIELTPRLAMLNRKAFGYIAGIVEADQTMLNTATCYRLEIVTQIVYYKDQNSFDDSWLWVKTNAFTSNLLVTEPTSIMLGTIICGVLTPTFGTHLTTQFESWMISNADDWQSHGLGGVPKPIFFDIDPETKDHLPVLGGSAFDISSIRYAISGARLRPPSLDPHHFHRKLADERKKAANAGTETTVKKEGRTVSIDPRGVDNVGYRQTTKDLYGQVQRKERRDESVLAHARRTLSRRRRSQEPKRGRSPGRTPTMDMKKKP